MFFLGANLWLILAIKGQVTKLCEKQAHVINVEPFPLTAKMPNCWPLILVTRNVSGLRDDRKGVGVVKRSPLEHRINIGDYLAKQSKVLLLA